MERQNLKINQQVLVIPNHTNKDLPAPKSRTMYVQELHNPQFAGLSHRPNEKKHVYGILYEVIHQIEKDGSIN
jgi:hypothetical protein